MAEYIRREDAYNAACDECEAGTFCDIPSKIMAMPTADVVEREVLDQVYWERDTALHQLAEIGKGLGAKMDDVVERKRGKWNEAWLDHQYCGCRPRAIYCSNCHIVSAFKTPFCPNCGADMRESEEEDG